MSYGLLDEVPLVQQHLLAQEAQLPARDGPTARGGEPAVVHAHDTSRRLLVLDGLAALEARDDVLDHLYLVFGIELVIVVCLGLGRDERHDEVGEQQRHDDHATDEKEEQVALGKHGTRGDGEGDGRGNGERHGAFGAA